MNEMQTFNHAQFGQVRTVTINGEPWFVVADVCDYFNVSNRNRIMQQIEDDERGVRKLTPQVENKRLR